MWPALIVVGIVFLLWGLFELRIAHRLLGIKEVTHPPFVIRIAWALIIGFGLLVWGVLAAVQWMPAPGHGT